MAFKEVIQKSLSMIHIKKQIINRGSKFDDGMKNGNMPLKTKML